MPEPYFTNGEQTIYLGRYEDIMPRMAKAAVDMVLVDPPYNANWQSGRRKESFDKIANDDGSFDTTDLLAQCLRVLRPYRHLYCFGPVDWGDLPIGGRCELVWDKGIIGPGDLTLPWGPSHEPIHFGVYVPSKSQRDRGDGRLSARIRKASVIRAPRMNSGQVSNHQTEKPVVLLRQLIESSSVMGEIVLDPCMGSGSTLDACRMEGRKGIGIDIDERNCEVAAKRLQQPALF